jgi:NAD(P)-dependent dehydrogenase (short-subunit alcohol dehydrogenase family)
MERGPLPSDRLRGRVCLVFGGGAPSDSVSVGQAAARAYAAAGAHVVIADATLANADRSAAFITGATVIAADITDDEAVAAAVAAAYERYGRIDVLHNNVGAPMAGDFDTLTSADWARGMELNCLGAARTMRHALPHLTAARGAIVNVSSVAGIRHTGINYAVYSASKAALDQMTMAVALEYASRGVRANAILPGLLDTDMGRSLPGGDRAERDRRSPTGAQGDVWDVAHAAVFLACDESRYVNGHLLVVDGGLSCRC